MSNKRKTDEGRKTAWDVLWIALSNPKVVTLLLVLAGGSTALHSDTVRNAINWDQTKPLPETPGEIALPTSIEIHPQVRQKIESFIAKLEEHENRFDRIESQFGRGDSTLQSQINHLKKWHE